MARVIRYSTRKYGDMFGVHATIHKKQNTVYVNVWEESRDHALESFKRQVMEILPDETAFIWSGWSVTPVTPGQIAFTAYGETRGWRNHDGSDTPTWENLGDEIRDAWEAAAQAAMALPGRTDG